MAEDITITWTPDDTRAVAARKGISLTQEDIPAFHEDCDFWLKIKVYETLRCEMDTALRGWIEARKRGNGEEKPWHPLGVWEIIRIVDRHVKEEFCDWNKACAQLAVREQNVLTYAMHEWVKTVAEHFEHSGTYWQDTVGAGYVHPDLWRLDCMDTSVLVLVEKCYLVLAPAGNSVGITLDGVRVALECEGFEEVTVFDQRLILEAIERLIAIHNGKAQ